MNKEKAQINMEMEMNMEAEVKTEVNKTGLILLAWRTAAS